MDRETKKISFSFSKSTKKANVSQNVQVRQKNIQLIDCLEAQTIKLKNTTKEVKGPLIIPLQQTSENALDRKRSLKIKRENISELNVDERLDTDLTADELAARELLRNAHNRNEKSASLKLYALPAITENSIEIEGKEEPTISDYESVPISEYGMAMLRGMGWTEGAGIGRNKTLIKINEPTLRPKGMGLGANKGRNCADIGKTPLLDKDGKELILKKGGYAVIVDGRQKGNYCEVQGFDDESGRIIVKTSLRGIVISLNEFLIKPVSKDEYLKSSKVINNAKYEEYKSKTEKFGEKGGSERELISVKANSSSQQTKSLSSEDSEDEHNSRRKTFKNDKEYNRNKYKKKSKKEHRSRSCLATESNERILHKERTRRSSSVSDNDHKKYRSKSKKKSKTQSSDSDKDYCYRRSRETSTKRKRNKY